MTIELEIEQFPSASRNNREAISRSDVCSCYFCLGSFSSADVVEWADQGKTALCPHCDIDALVPGMINQEQLIQANVRYFAQRAGSTDQG